MNTEVNMTTLHVAMPREGHLDTTFHTFADLKIKHIQEWYLTHHIPVLIQSNLRSVNRKISTKGTKEAIPRMPLSQGVRMYISDDL